MFSHTSANSRHVALACASSAPPASSALLLPEIRLETAIGVSIAVVAVGGVAADGAVVEEAVGKAVAEAKGWSFDDPAGCAAAAGVSLGRPSTTLEVYNGNHTRLSKLSLSHRSLCGRRRMERLTKIPSLAANVLIAAVHTAQPQACRPLVVEPLELLSRAPAMDTFSNCHKRRDVAP